MTERKFKYCISCGAEMFLIETEGRQRSACPQCGWIQYENPVPCAAAFVSSSQGEILLVQRGIEPGKGQWALPSGFIEIDETPEGACLRELKEETGLEGKILRLLGVYSQESAMYKHVLIIGFEVKTVGTPLPGSDSIDVRYFLSDGLPEIAFSSHLEMIEDGLKRRQK